MQLKPSQIEAVESLRESPYRSMFGCCEIEEVAKQIIKWLTEHGDCWYIDLPELDVFESRWSLKHEHTVGGGDPYVCDFVADYMDGSHVNQLFVDMCNRHYNHQLRCDVLRKLFPRIIWNRN